MTTKRMKHLKDLMIRARANASENLAAWPDIQFIEKLNGALKRMEGGTYGSCLVCGGDIGESNLLVQPWAENCAACQAYVISSLHDCSSKADAASGFEKRM
ncbi:MAG TPA: TraR/DksA C4-type zinc finger protein [Bryobacteraceae bacterium]|jgi:hypothetical protein